jgi:hypothetical protein
MRPILAAAVTFLLLAPASALAQSSGEGLYGETNDKVVTDFGFILIGFFPLFIFLMSLLQWSLERRKDKRKKAAKLAGGESRWSGGW